MFGKKCPSCGKKVKRDYDFCPFCSKDLRSKVQEERDYGFLGKEDVRTAEDDLFAGLPLPFRIMVKPLMKELNKQIGDLDKELKKERVESQSSSNTRKPVGTTFKIHFGAPGQRPIELRSLNRPIKKISSPVDEGQKTLPQIALEDLKKANKLPIKEPETIVRRLSDSIIYEVKLPGVSSMSKIGIVKVAAGFEIKAFSNKELFVKYIDLDLKVVDFYLSDETLVLEFDNSK